MTGTDKAGNVTVVERSYRVLDATNTNGGVSGNVPATLGLTLGPAIQLGAFTPGVTRTYTASTTANVISSAGDATLSVVGPEHDQHQQAGQRRLRAAPAVLHHVLEVHVDRSGLQRLVTIGSRS